MKNLQKHGAFSAFYLAFAYLTGIIIFFFIFDYPSIIEPSQKMDLLLNYQLIMYITNIIMYVIFGLVLVIFSLSLYHLLKDKSLLIMQIVAVIGIIWAGLLIGSGMVANSGISTVLELYKNEPSQATMIWLGIESVSHGLGGAKGEILGGLMMLLISIVGIRNSIFPKFLNYLGIFIGVIGIISTFPGLSDFAGLFGISQMIWFIWIGVILLKKDQNKEF